MKSSLFIERRHNHPAAGKAGIASWLAIGHPCPGLPEPGRLADAGVESVVAVDFRNRMADGVLKQQC